MSCSPSALRPIVAVFTPGTEQRPGSRHPAGKFLADFDDTHGPAPRSVARSVPGLLPGRMTELPQVRAARIPMRDTYHGIDVIEDYQWLEDASGQDAIEWTPGQEKRTRAYFGQTP